MLMSYFISDVYKRETNPINSFDQSIGHFKTKNGVGSAEKKGLITHAFLDVMSEHSYLFECVHLKTR